MTWHTMICSEGDPNHPGFIRRYYATVDVSMPGGTWYCYWQQVDANGKLIGNAAGPFPAQEDAKADALRQLNGDEWE